MNNKQKGDAYEIYTKEYIGQMYNNIYLWSEIPEDLLISTRIISCYGDKRLVTKKFTDSKKLQDRGCDILYHDGEKWIVVQCKNYAGAVGLNDLAGFCWITRIAKLFGEVYYTNRLSQTLIEMLYYSPDVKTIRLPMGNPKVDPVIRTFKFKMERL